MEIITASFITGASKKINFCKQKERSSITDFSVILQRSLSCQSYDSFKLVAVSACSLTVVSATVLAVILCVVLTVVFCTILVVVFGAVLIAVFVAILHFVLTVF